MSLSKYRFILLPLGLALVRLLVADRLSLLCSREFSLLNIIIGLFRSYDAAKFVVEAELVADFYTLSRSYSGELLNSSYLFCFLFSLLYLWNTLCHPISFRFQLLIFSIILLLLSVSLIVCYNFLFYSLFCDMTDIFDLLVDVSFSYVFIFFNNYL